MKTRFHRSLRDILPISRRSAALSSACPFPPRNSGHFFGGAGKYGEVPSCLGYSTSKMPPGHRIRFLNTTAPHYVRSGDPSLQQLIQDAVKNLRPQIEEFLTQDRFVSWIPQGQVNENIKQFYRDLAIPSIQGNPTLLLHRLGEKLNPFVDEVFGAPKHCILFNTPGSGKTRTLLEGLCKRWGFYFVAETDISSLGSDDMAHAIDRMTSDPAWIADIFPEVPNSNYTRVANSINETIALREIFKVLAARWIVFRTFIEVARDMNAGILPDNIQLDWLLFQILPRVDPSQDPFISLSENCFENCTLPEMRSLTRRVCTTAFLGDNVPQTFIYVLDEAQVAGQLHMGAFADKRHQVIRPVLGPILKALGNRNPNVRTRIVVSGTGFSLDLFKALMVSTTGKPAVWNLIRMTSYLFDREIQEEYIRRFLPPSFFLTRSGSNLLIRMYEWLRGRYRFTASYLERLLSSTWKADLPGSPHKLLNAYIRAFTEFTPLDADDTLLHAEPDIRAPQIDGFAWAKIDQEPRLLHDLAKSIQIYMTRGYFPGTYDERQQLVEYGLAFFIDGEENAVVREPLALVSIARHFEERGLTVYSGILDRVQGTSRASKGEGFEEVVVLALTQLFRRGACLDEVFQFHGDTPTWASQTAQIVSRRADGTLGVFDLAIGEPEIPSASIAYYAEYPADVERWIRLMPAGWCVPGQYMGPDILAWLRLLDGRLLLLVIQTKCYLSGNTNTLPHVTAQAIQQTCPSNFFAKSTKAASKKATQQMLAAINKPKECFTGEKALYNVLRVVVGFPLGARFDTPSEKIKMAIARDPHPLATLDHTSLVSSLSKFNDAPSILAWLASRIQKDAGNKC